MRSGVGEIAVKIGLHAWIEKASINFLPFAHGDWSDRRCTLLERPFFVFVKRLAVGYPGFGLLRRVINAKKSRNYNL